MDKDKNENGIKDRTDAKLRYIAGFSLLLFAFVGFFVGKMDTSLGITSITFGSVLIGEEKAGSIVAAIKK